MDFISWDNYPANEDSPAMIAMNHELMRGIKGGQPFILMEQTPSVTNWLPYNALKRPGVMRLWSYQAVAHGSDSVMFFQMRRSVGACEKLHGAVIDHAGTNETRVYREVRALGEELDRIGGLTLGAREEAKVALYFDWDNWWAVECSAGPSCELKYKDEILNYYETLHSRNIAVDLVGPEDDLDGYKMLIAPVIFCTVVIGIAGMEDMKKVGKVGGLALLYFEAVTTLALFVGLFLVNILQPGAGMHVDPATLDMNSVSMYATAEKPQSTLDFLFHIIPSSVVGAFAQGDILQVLFFSIIFGFALQFLGGSRHPVYELIKKGSDILFLMINWIMKVAPIGAFGAMAFTIGKYGIHSLLPLGKLMLVFYATCLFFVLGILGAICRFNGFSILRYLAYIKEELLIVLGTSSSEAVLPQMITKMQKAGVSRSVTGLVIPTGYSFNLDGTAIYLTMAAVFIAQACDIQMTFTQQALAPISIKESAEQR